ncbi:hypothetical protein D3C78_1232740 [compost metagenome]
MVHENPAVAPVAKQRPAQFSDLGRCGHPAGGFQVELAEFLEFAVLRVGQQRDAHGRGRVDGIALGPVFLAGLPGLRVVAQASAAHRAVNGAIEEAIGAAGIRRADDIGLAAGAFHREQRPQLVVLGLQALQDGVPGYPGMAVHAVCEALLQGLDENFTL